MYCDGRQPTSVHPQHLGSVGGMHIRYDHADGVGASCFQIHDHRIATIAKATGLAKHGLTRLASNNLIAGKGTGYR